MGNIEKIENVDPKKLIPYTNNAKIHNDMQLEKIKESIKSFGFITPCLIDKDFNIIAGHGRVMAALELELEDVPCVFLEGLSENQKKAYILADNKLSELAEWDEKIVAQELKDLHDADFDTDVTGFLYEEIDFSFLSEKEKAQPKKVNEIQECQCPKCKCIFEGNEIIEHGIDFNSSET